MSGDSGSKRGAAPLAVLPRRSPLAMLVEAQRGRTPVSFFDARATLAATLEAAAEHLAAACYAVDAYQRLSGEAVAIGDEVRQAITTLSRLSREITPASPACASTGPGIPGEFRGADHGAGHG